MLPILGKFKIMGLISYFSTNCNTPIYSTTTYLTYSLVQKKQDYLIRIYYAKVGCYRRLRLIYIDQCCVIPSSIEFRENTHVWCHRCGKSDLINEIEQAIF